MKRGPIVFLMAVVLTGICGTPVQAFNQPPLNLGLTDILDGGVPGVGTFFTEYVQAYESDTFKDQNGDDIPGQPDIGVLLSMNQLVHVYKHKILGAHIGVDVLLPVVSISGNGIPTNPGLLGDLTVGPFLQWLDEGDSGDIPDSKEQVFAIGPALHYFFSDKFSAGLKTQWESSAENRPEGNRTTLRFTYLF